MTTTILYKQTCEFCDKVSKLTLSFVLGLYEAGESFGRAKAVEKLYRQGHINVSKQLMLNKDKHRN